MSADDASEIRRQKILLNSQRRLELVMGLKSSEALREESAHSIDTLKLGNNANANANHDNAAIREESLQEKPSSLKEYAQTYFKFNGYSNIEFLALLSVALFSSLTFFYDCSYLINGNALALFFTFESAFFMLQVVSNFRYLQLSQSKFSAILLLFGIRKQALNHVTMFIQVLFIFIDHIILYLACFFIMSFFLLSIIIQIM